MIVIIIIRRTGHANIRDDKAVSDDYSDDRVGFICAITARARGGQANEYLPAESALCPRRRRPRFRIAYVMLFI